MSNEYGLEGGRNLTIFVLFIVTIVASIYLQAIGVESAGFYLSLAVAFGVIIFLSYVILPDERWKNIVRLHMAERSTTANKWFTIGFIPPIAGLFIGTTVFAEIMSPQFIFSQKLYQSLTVGVPAFNRVLIEGFFAGTFEELFFGIACMIMGGIALLWVLESFGWKASDKQLTPLFLAGGLVTSGALFTVFHLLNPTYTAPMFLFALIFRSVFNVIIFFTGISLAVGFHIANNLSTMSLPIIIAGFGAFPHGWILIAILVIIFGSAIYSLARDRKEERLIPKILAKFKNI